jgi:hypothetical protein
MSFRARKLRVQLPCGTDGSVIAEEVGGGGDGGDCDWPTGCKIFTCDAGTCVNVFTTQGFPTQTVVCQWVSTCDLGYGTCPADTCPAGSCTAPSPCAVFGTRHCAANTCLARTIVVGPGTLRDELIVDADQLPALRERLERQLEEIEKAERAVEEHRRQHEE